MAAAEADARHETAIVALANVRKVYQLGQPVVALDDVDFSMEEGSYVAVMGPSGSGKSTLMNVIGCLDTPTSGRLTIRGRTVTGLSDQERAKIRREMVGFIFQTFNLMPTLTALENVELPMVFAGRPRSERRERARSLLEAVHLEDRIHHRPSELSGGQRQRVSIARALANDPTILLADEPTGSVDTETGKTILGLFQRLNDEGRTILVVTHERHVAEHADQIVHLVDGTIEEIEQVGRSREVAEENVPWTR